jgi:hypothetical protein
MRRVVLGVVLAACLPALVLANGGTAPRWVVPIDSRTTDQWLSENAGVVYGARDGHLVALDLHDGHVVWRSNVAPATKSAAVANAVVTPTASGLTFLRALDGSVVRRVPLDSAPIVASSRNGFVSVTQTGNGVEARGWTLNGQLRWTEHYRGAPFGTLLQLGGDAIGLTVPGTGELLVIDGSDGRGVASADGVDALIGADGRYLWFNVVGGGIKGIDLDTNRSIALHGSIVRGAARVEHSVAVAVVDGRLTRIDLRSGSQQILKVDGRWIGGPSDGRIFIERADGVYVRSLALRARQHRVARYAGEARLVAADRNIGMIAMEDGRIFIVDVPNARHLATIETPCTSYEGFAVSGSTTLVHCDSHLVSELLSFDRYALSR